MKALLKTDRQVSVKKIPDPPLGSPDEVLIQVAVSGLCRTDVYVADGLVDCKNPLVLGHEFSGTIVQTGNNVDNLSPGDRVAVMPFFSPGTRPRADASDPARPTMLGVDYDGSFSEYVVVPASAAYVIPDNMTFKTAAYMEPVAASLGCINAAITPQEKGLIYGDNRISRLTERALRAMGFNNIEVVSDRQATDTPLPPAYYDYIIETMATTETMARIINALKPGGLIVIKSRQHTPIALNFNSLVHREIRLQAVNYGNFSECIDLVASGKLIVDDLFGDTYPLDEFEEVFALSRKGENKKLFLSASGIDAG